MNIDIMLAILTQAANYISLVGSYLAQTAAEIAAEKPRSSLMDEVADSYNVLGNQLTTIGLAVYSFVGQIAINQAIADANASINNANTDNNQNSEAASLENSNTDEVAEYLRVWHIKRIKRLRRRRWRTIKHLG